MLHNTWPHHCAAPIYLQTEISLYIQNYNPFSNSTEPLVQSLYKLHSSSYSVKLSLTHDFLKIKTMVPEVCLIVLYENDYILFRRAYSEGRFGRTLFKTPECVMQDSKAKDAMQESQDVIQDALIAKITSWGVMQDSKAKDAMQEFQDIMQDSLDAKQIITRRYARLWHLYQQQQSVKNKTN